MKLKKALLSVLCFCLFFMFFTSCAKKEAIHIPNTALSESLSVDYVYDISETVIRGTVKSKGEAFYKDGMIFTPVKIKVSEVYKGEDVPKMIVYNELGGEKEDREFIYDSLPALKKGNKAVIFLDANNRISAVNGIYKIKHGKMIFGQDSDGNDILMNYNEIRELMNRLEKSTAK